MRTVKLSSGDSLPLVGLGTWDLRGKECTEVVKKALDLGYRHIDTAIIYENHQAIGKAISDFPRDELFITSKFLLDLDLEEACDQALSELKVNYLDLFLIHSPDRNKPMIEILRQMQKLKERGMIRHFGVSNFNIHHLQDILDAGISLSVNQVEFHPYLYQKELWDFCKRHGIQLIAYRSLGKGALIKDPLFSKIGDYYKKTAAQVILRWVIQKGIPVIPKASSLKHLKENISLFDFSLTDNEMEEIDHLNRNQRFCISDWSDFNY